MTTEQLRNLSEEALNRLRVQIRVTIHVHGDLPNAVFRPIGQIAMDRCSDSVRGSG